MAAAEFSSSSSYTADAAQMKFLSASFSVDHLNQIPPGVVQWESSYSSCINRYAETATQLLVPEAPTCKPA
jgi:hypothetical protein